MSQAPKKQPRRPRDRPPQGITADRSDETYRVDRPSCCASGATRAHRYRIVALLVGGLERDKHVVERMRENILYIEWGEEAAQTREGRTPLVSWPYATPRRAMPNVRGACISDDSRTTTSPSALYRSSGWRLYRRP